MNNECSSTECPVHFRNDVTRDGEYGYPYFITYLGEYAVYSDVGAKENRSPEESLKTALEAFVLLMTGAPREETEELINRSAESFTHIYKVGDGAIMDTPPVEKYHGRPGDVEEMHTIAVEMVKVRQEV